MTRKRGLGRGLEALIPTPVDSPEPQSGISNVDVDSIDPNPYQPRIHFDEKALESLADSIKAQGVLEPLRLRPSVKNRYQLVFGERRLRAARKAGLSKVPALIIDTGDQAMREIALVENIQREDLNPLDEAAAYRDLAEIHKTQEEVAQRVGKDRATVANAIRLLSLPQSVKDLIYEGRIQKGHAKALLSLDQPLQMSTLAEEVARKGLSVRKTEAMVKALSKKGVGKSAVPESMDAELRDVADRIMRKLGTKVQVKGSVQKGTLVIEYYSQDDLDRISEIILGLES